MRVDDLRGITDTLKESHHRPGLLRCEVGTGGEAVEYRGRDFPLGPLLDRAPGR
uniref:hypothetical protein n=1 Tax=Streptomyces sp. DG1A-41 TaxID=3125779 RepID=UPI0040402BBD